MGIEVTQPCATCGSAPIFWDARHRQSSIASLTGAPADIGGWIIGSSDGAKWRVWTELGPDWTDDRYQATRYARRVDAEQVHAADEDAWRVEPFSEGAEAPDADRIATSICRSVAEIPDRSSPDDQPEMMLVTADELHTIVICALENEGDILPAPLVEGTLRAMDRAPRDGRYIIAVYRSLDGYAENLHGRAFVVRHEGETPSGYDLGWALFPGHGGVPDKCLSGWAPLPAPSFEAAGK